MIQAYVDESGGKNQTKTFVLSALIADAEEWARKADEWDAVLKETPSIRYFKMDEAVGLNGEFYGISDSERDKKLTSLCRVIAVPTITELSITLRIEDFLSNWAPQLGRPASEPYFFPFQGIHISIAYELLSRGHTERCEVFFDEHKIFGSRAKMWYPVIRCSFPTEIQGILPVEPFFRDDKEVLPLQAADLTAWIQRMHSSNGSLDEFEWVVEELRGIKVSRFHKMIDSDFIATLGSSEQNDEERKRKLDIMEAYKKNFGFEWPPKTKTEKRRHSGR